MVETPPMSPEKIITRVTYLQIQAPFPERPAIAPRDGVSVERAMNPSLPLYRQLYSGVGGSYQWSARILMADEALARIVQDSRVEVHVLSVHGKTAGYVELDGRTEGEMEIAYFGLFPEFYGKKLGSFLLDWAVGSLAKRPGLKRIWVHTCTLDHPGALSTYRKAGFVPYLEKDEWVDPLPT